MMRNSLYQHRTNDANLYGKKCLTWSVGGEMQLMLKRGILLGLLKMVSLKLLVVAGL